MQSCMQGPIKMFTDSVGISIIILRKQEPREQA